MVMLGSSQILAPAAVAVRQSAGQSCATSAVTYLTWDVEEYDITGMHDLVTNPSRITCLVSGRYNVNGIIQLAPSATANFRFAGSLQKNRTGNVIATAEYSIANSSVYPGISLSGDVDMVVGDYVEAYIYHEAGASLNSYYLATRLTARRVDGLVGYASVSPGVLLASVVYGLPSDASTSSYTPYTKVDASNLFLTFVAPPSGQVLFKWCCTLTGTGGVNMGVGPTGAVATAMVVSTGISETARSVSPAMMVTGLTPGTVYTYFLWFAVSVSGTAVVQDSGYGPVLFEVWVA